MPTINETTRDFSEAFHLDREDIIKIGTLVRMLKVVEPETSIDFLETDEREPFIHIGSPSAVVDYYIEPDERGLWTGRPNGRLGLPVVPPKASPGRVARMVAIAFAGWLASSALSAQAILSGSLS